MAKYLIYLASGSARRFGSNKLLFPLEGKPLFLYGLETLAEAAAQREGTTLTVVSRYPVIRAAAEKLGAAAVDSPYSQLGLSHTIRAGLDALPPLKAEDFVLFAVADQPWLQTPTVLRLMDAARPGVTAGTTVWEGRAGSPTFFSAALVPRLRRLEGDQGGRVVLRSLGSACVGVPAGSGRELEDVDWPEQLREPGRGRLR